MRRRREEDEEEEGGGGTTVISRMACMINKPSQLAYMY